MMRIALVKEDIKIKDFDPYSIKKYQIVQPVGYGRIQNLKCYSLNHLIFFNRIRTKIFDFYIFFD